ncbi:DUF4245 domain-containing protein [Lysinimonas soli]|uniref:DUF4245 domain-containing protein n=1 Tax=Lysinimonas soli TaxID=1074233 RepID=A0ABW0NPZ8_9MICO
MNDRKGLDDSGRPIVAELGRAETPQETADRKAAATVAHRSNQTVLNLVIALAASLLVVFVIVVVVVRPDQAGAPKAVDYAAVARDAQPSVSTPLLVPTLPKGWSANRAELVDAASSSDGIASWQIGLLTPSTQYIGLVQGLDANASWIASQLHDKKATGQTSFDGSRWQVYDHRADSNPGNLAYALVTTVGASTVVLAGTASDSEFATLATEITKELNG